MSKAKSQPNMPAEKYPLGHAKEAKDASTWSYKFPTSTGTAKDIGVYAQPGVNTHPGGTEYMTDPNSMSANESTPGGMPARRVSGGNITRGPKTEGITMRGYGAATKGIKSRGPMA
jgi:hypothetical protein